MCGHNDRVQMGSCHALCWPQSRRVGADRSESGFSLEPRGRPFPTISHRPKHQWRGAPPSFRACLMEVDGTFVHLMLGGQEK
jgi:hypothetical protein